MIKYCYGYNQYVTREKIINKGVIVDDCPRYSGTEDWAHIVQCPSLTEQKINFLVELQDKLLQKRNLTVTKNEIKDIIGSIKKFLFNNNYFITN